MEENQTTGSQDIPLVQAIAPVRSAERVAVIDSLRGLAILGILLINIFYYFQPLAYLYGTIDLPQTLPDRIADALMRFVAQGKFYSMFSLLFGVGMAVQMERCLARGQHFVRFFSTRMFFLFLIGWVHGVFFFSGDILNNYALIGLLLLVFRNCSNRTLMIYIAVFYVLGGLCIGLLMLIPSLLTLAGLGEVIEGQVTAQHAEFQALYDQTMVVFTNGSFWEVCAFRAGETLRMLAFLPFFGISILLCFITGVWAWRRGVFRDPQNHTRLLWRLLLIGGVLGGSLSLFFGLVAAFDGSPVMQGFAGFANNAGAYFHALAYVSAFLLLAVHNKCAKLFEMLSYVGRMALTNYLMHSVVFSIMASGYGLGLYGKLGHFACLMLTLAMFAFQIFFSRAWLTRYRFGPVEWLWRSLTYRKPQPMRRK